VPTLPFIMVLPEGPITCSHVDRIRNVRPNGSRCDDCILVQDTWLQLRMCMECGHVGCCDLSKNKHAVRHFRATQHPIARSIESGEEWGWCYVDQIWFEKLPFPL
jgi:monovalent cation:H+ antiporter-2, CPA2 family